MIYCLSILEKSFSSRYSDMVPKNIKIKPLSTMWMLTHSTTLVLRLAQKELEINTLLLSNFTCPHEKFSSLLIFLCFVLSLSKDRLSVQPLNIFHHTQGYLEPILVLYFLTFIFLKVLEPLFPQSIDLIFFVDKEETMKMRGKKMLLLKALIKQHK